MSTTEEQKDLSTERLKELKQFVQSIEDRAEECPELQMDRYGFGAWSISKLKVLQKCPLQFFLKYVLKIKVPEHIGGRQETLSADVGSAGHRILEFVMLGRPIDTSFALTKKEFVPSKLTEAQWESEVENLHMSISAFKDRMEGFTRRHPIRRVFTEMRVGVDKDWHGCTFFDDKAYFRGIIDLCLELEDGNLIILDHKTASGFTPTSTKNYDTQLNSYKPLFHFGVNPVQGAQAGIHFIRAGEVKMGEYHSVEDISTKLIRDLEWEFSGAVDRVSELGYFKHICGSTCKWCEYASMCKSPEKLLKPLEMGTKKFIPIAKA